MLHKFYGHIDPLSVIQLVGVVQTGNLQAVVYDLAVCIYCMCLHMYFCACICTVMQWTHMQDLNSCTYVTQEQNFSWWGFKYSQTLLIRTYLFQIKLLIK